MTGRLGGIQTRTIKTGIQSVEKMLQKYPTYPSLNGRSGSAFLRPTRRRSVCGAAIEIFMNRTADVMMELKAVELARYSNPYKQVNTSVSKVARAGNFIFVSTCAKNLGNGSPPSLANAQAIRPEAVYKEGSAARLEVSAKNRTCNVM